MGHRLSKLNWTQSNSSRNLNQNYLNPNKKTSTSFVQIVSIVNTSDTFDQRLLALNQDFQIESAVEEPLPKVTPTQMIITIKLTKMEPGNNNQMDNNNATSLPSKDHGNALCGNFKNNLDSDKQLVNLKIKKNLLRDVQTTITINDSVGTDSVNKMELNNLNRTINDDNAKSTRKFTNNFTPNRGLIGLINNENGDEQSDNLVEMYTQSGDSTSWTAARVNECNKSNNLNNNTIIASYNNCKQNGNCNISTLPINMTCSTASLSLCNTADRISHNTKLLPEEHNVPICYNNNNMITKPINDCNSGHALRPKEDHINRNSLQEITSNKYPSIIHCVCTESMETPSFRHTDQSTSSSASKHFTDNHRDSGSSESQKQNNKNCDTWSVSTQGSSACFQQHLLHTVTRHGPNVIVLSVMEQISDRGVTNGECNQVKVPIACIQDTHFNSNMFSDSTYSQDHCVQVQPQKLTVHSQADYFHCLVPDLEKITSSSFYWGKMDRYEAERLLEGKPEGTFLLRDSAQEEYLFSVTFRKYERSLHARIEQFNHKFSFDCHDPGVFTAPTVTGLLEHYKDPTCVMFFEPMLAIPLPRKFSFSLQQLCRATIVSNINYDGVNDLLLPNSLKAYLKEYHYKFRVRVKPCDDLLYSCS